MLHEIIVPELAESTVEATVASWLKKDGEVVSKGDVIIEINRKKVRNIYDYMARLADLKNGDKIIVKIIRDTEEMELILEL